MDYPSFLPWWVKPLLIGALVLALLAAAHHVSVAFRERDALKVTTGQLQVDLSIQKQLTAATEAVITARMADKVRIVTVTKEVTRAIPTFIPAGTPALPGGFRVLHDSAAAGVLPGAPLGADAAPVPAEAVAEVVIDNYGTCFDNSSRLERLQQWISNSSKPASAP